MDRSCHPTWRLACICISYQCLVEVIYSKLWLLLTYVTNYFDRHRAVTESVLQGSTITREIYKWWRQSQENLDQYV